MATVAMGGRVEMGCKVVGLEYETGAEKWGVQYRDPEGNLQMLAEGHDG